MSAAHGEARRTRKRLGKDSGAKVAFVAITVDPERDTPEVLRSYAQAHGANAAGWAFLTGTPAEIQDVTRRYGVFARKTSRGDVDHTFLTSLVDRDGALRVQYMGVRFDPDEMLRDLRALLREAAAGDRDLRSRASWRGFRRRCTPSSWSPSWPSSACSSRSAPSVSRCSAR